MPPETLTKHCPFFM